MKKDNRIVVELGKCQYARFFYRNQYGDRVDLKPRSATYRGQCYDKNEMAYGEPKETMLQRLKRKGALDFWIPIVRFQLQANHSLEYTGEKAKQLWKEWQRRIFKNS